MLSRAPGPGPLQFLDGPNHLQPHRPVSWNAGLPPFDGPDGRDDRRRPRSDQRQVVRKGHLISNARSRRSPQRLLLPLVDVGIARILDVGKNQPIGFLRALR